MLTIYSCIVICQSGNKSGIRRVGHLAQEASMSTRAPDYNDKTDETPLPSREQRRPASAVLEPNEARQGVTHHNVRYVLAIGLLLVVVAFGVIYLFATAREPSPTATISE